MQSKLDSALEALTNILIGAGVALAAQYLWFPAIDINLSHGEHLATTGVFTAVSFARSYFVRRWFDGKPVYQTLKNVILGLVNKIEDKIMPGGKRKKPTNGGKKRK